jgi:hypothetical protein
MHLTFDWHGALRARARVKEPADGPSAAARLEALSLWRPGLSLWRHRLAHQLVPPSPGDGSPIPTVDNLLACCGPTPPSSPADDRRALVPMVEEAWRVFMPAISPMPWSAGCGRAGGFRGGHAGGHRLCRPPRGRPGAAALHPARGGGVGGGAGPAGAELGQRLVRPWRRAGALQPASVGGEGALPGARQQGARQPAPGAAARARARGCPCGAGGL